MRRLVIAQWKKFAVGGLDLHSQRRFILSVTLILLPIHLQSQISQDETGNALRQYELLAARENPSARVSADVLGESPALLSGEVDVVFITEWNFDTGNIRYMTIKPEVVSHLLVNPIVTSPPDLQVKLVGLEATPVAQPVGSALLEGIRIRCQIEVRPQAPMNANRSIIIAFPTVENVASYLETMTPRRPPAIHYDLTLFTSEEERRLHLEEADRARQERAKAADLEKRRESRSKLYNFLKWLGLGIAALYVVGVSASVIKRVWMWSFPKHCVMIGTVTSETAMGEVELTRQISEGEIHRVPGPFHEEKKASTFFGSERDVIVELNGVLSRREVNLVTSTFTNDAGTSTSTWHEEVLRYQVVIRARKGSRVGAGCYLAKTSAGTVKVRILS